MSPHAFRKLSLAVVLVSCFCAAQTRPSTRPAVTSGAATAATSATDSCTTLDGRPVPCPDDSGNKGAPTSPQSGGDHCTTLDGRQVPCPDDSGAARAATGAVAPAAQPTTSGDSAGKRNLRAPEAVKPSSADRETTPPPAAPGTARSSDCTNLAGTRSMPCPAVYSGAQQNLPAPRTTHPSASPSSLSRAFVGDQRRFWTSPLQVREKDLDWIIPFAGLTAVTMGSDRGIEGHLPTNPSVISQSKSFSNYAVAGMAAAGAGMFALGHLTQNDHMSETGLLSGEAAVNGLAVAEGLKLVFRRQRPLDGNGRGNFFSGGSSFPSIHSTVAWSIASVVAHEYPGIIPTLFSYGAASAVSATRVTGRQHWASDALIGSALGWYMGRQVYRAHAANEQVDQWGTFVRPVEASVRPPSRMGSPYVPLDSWVYAAFDRLAALGYVQSAITGLRPWTRLECARLVSEAGDNITGNDVPKYVFSLYDDLQREFRPEIAQLDGGRNLGAQVDSIYTRVTGISGQPLTDSYHFGQTLYNDYGRPYQEGFNMVTGTSVQAEAGPLAFFVRGEYQHSPFAPGYSLATRQAIATADAMPVMPDTPFNVVNRARLLDAYVSLNLNNWQLSFGKQSLWWGPDTGGDLLFSDNAEPVTMLRVDRVTPVKLPGLFGFLGGMRSQLFLGQLSGDHFLKLGPQFVLTGSPTTFVNPQPYIYGTKINFKPTSNLEFGASLTSVFAGQGRPLTIGTLEHTLSPHGNAQDIEPGDRRAGFDFSYHIPGLRNRLVLYNGAMTEDDINPIGYPRRSAMNPGIYLPRVPGVPKMDLRVEGVYTNLPGLRPQGFFYTNTHYADGYRNNGQIIGDWIGRQGSGVQAWSTYWLSAQRKLQFGYRHQTTDKSFIGGGNLSDFSVQGDWAVVSNWTVSAGAQYERWNFPFLSVGPQTNVSTMFQLTYRPGMKLGSGATSH